VATASVKNTRVVLAKYFMMFALRGKINVEKSVRKSR
jgi:hypothetical protein